MKKIWFYIAGAFAALLAVFTLGRRRGKQDERREDAKDILKEAEEFHDEVEKMDDDAAADALDGSIDNRLDRLDRKRRKRT